MQPALHRDVTEARPVHNCWSTNSATYAHQKNTISICT